MTIVHSIPQSRMEYLQDEFFGNTNLKDLLKNEELIKTIEIFLQNDLNVLKTSKQTFMHRNTLLYRIGKIKKMVGLDIRRFEDAMILKFLIEFYKEEQKTIV